MPIDVVVPAIGESIQEAFIGRWLKNVGDRVEAGQSRVPAPPARIPAWLTKLTTPVYELSVRIL